MLLLLIPRAFKADAPLLECRYITTADPFVAVLMSIFFLKSDRNVMLLDKIY